MEIIKDKITGLEYVDIEDILDEISEIDNIAKLVINGELNYYIHEVIRKFISFNCILSDLRSKYTFTHDEVVIYKYRLSELYFDLEDVYDDAKRKDGLWKYINNYTIEQVYAKSSPCEDLQLSDIFEDGDFLKNIMKVKGGYINT